MVGSIEHYWWLQLKSATGNISRCRRLQLTDASGNIGNQAISMLKKR